MKAQEANTIQEIQLELIRRVRFKALDGQRIADDLLRVRALWRGVLIDRADDVVKLRDMADNVWNVDTLYVLARDESCGRHLAELKDRWQADWVTVHGEEETETALAKKDREDERLVTFWWE